MERILGCRQKKLADFKATVGIDGEHGRILGVGVVGIAGNGSRADGGVVDEDVDVGPACQHLSHTGLD